MKSWNKADIILGAGYITAWLLFFWVLDLILLPASFSGREGNIFIKSKTGVREIAQQLYQEGYIGSPLSFLVTVELKGLRTKLKAGEYQLKSSLSLMSIIQKMEQGQVVRHRVTVPEGYNYREITALLTEKGLGIKERYQQLFNDRQLLKAYNLEGETLEGYLFPDTYELTRSLSEEEILRKMLTRMQEVLNRDFGSQLKNSRMTLHQVLTLASLVEKETSVPAERPLIAQVFFNRLRTKTPLECDPTVIYALERFNGRLSRRDLQTNSPYNTYRHPGLPPGPVANPGKAAIEAVLNPTPSKFFYFVAKGDGTHHFSTTKAEHQRAVIRYRIKRS